MASTEPVNWAFVCNEPTPYRLHLLGRMARELGSARLHSIFTHRFHDASAPWKMQADDEIGPVFFEDLALEGSASLVRCRRLFHALRDYLTSHNIRLIVLHGYNDWCRLMLARWARRQGIPVLLRGDSNVYSEGRVPLLRRSIKGIYLRWLLTQVSGLMPMGTCGRAFFRLWSDHRLPTFLCPYEPDYSRLQNRDDAAAKAFMQSHGLDPARRRLLYCGRLVPVKRVDVLLDAFAQLHGTPDRAPRGIAMQDLDRWDLVIAGDGPLRAQLEARVPAALKHRVHWLGFLQFDQAVLCYHSCDVLVHPSEYEPWALVINEAVAAGLAVIATEVTGAAVELVRHRINGMIVPPGDVRQLAAAMAEVMSGENCKAMQHAAPAMLDQWRRAADPVDGVRQAFRYFNLG